MKRNTTKTIHVGHFLFSLGKGGMENGVVKLVNHSVGSNIRHTIITLTQDHALEKFITNSDVKIISIGRRDVIRNTIKLCNVLHSEKIDVLHARGWPTMFEAGTAKILMPRLKTAFAFHGRAFHELNNIGITRRIAQIMLARMFNRVNTLTLSMRNEISKEFLIKKSKVSILPNGVPGRTKVGIGSSVLKDELKIDPNEIVFGFIGRLDKVKRIDVLLDAFETFYSEKKEGWLVVVGDGDLRDSLEAYAATLSSKHRILFYGYSEDVFLFYNVFDVYLQSSDYEGLSNTILEALSCGLPLICTNAGGNRDIIDSGVNGFLVEKGDSEKMALHMKDLYDNKKQKKIMGEINITKYNDYYSIKAMVESYSTYYYLIFNTTCIGIC